MLQLWQLILLVPLLLKLLLLVLILNITTAVSVINVTGVVCAVVIAATNNTADVLKDALCNVAAYVPTPVVILLL